MPRFEVKQSSKLQLTSYSSPALIGQCCQAAQVETETDPKIPVSQSMHTSDVVKMCGRVVESGQAEGNTDSGKYNMLLREVKTVAAIAAELDAHACPPAQIESVSIDQVAGIHQGLHRAIAQRPHRLRCIPFDTSSTSSGMPTQRSTRCGASSSAQTSRS